MNLGLEIKGVDKDSIQKNIEFSINQTDMDNISFYNEKLIKISKENLLHFISNYMSYYFYVEYTRGKIKKLYLTDGAILKEFLQEHIVPERREGLDLIIMLDDSSHAFIVNHDGMIFTVLI